MNIKKIIVRTLTFCFLAVNLLNATTYYVDAVQGNNSNSGTSSTSAWKTISKVNSTTFRAGDQILLKRGGRWREQISITTSGSSVSPITIGDYGTGNKPVISGADLVTGFLLNSGSVWKKTGISSVPQQVFFNGIRGSKKASLAEVSAVNSWYYDSSTGTLYIFSSGDPASKYTLPGIEKTSRSYGIYINSVSYLIYKNLQVEKTTDSGIKITSSAQRITADSLTLLQWSVQEAAIGGVGIVGNYCEIKNCTLGKNTGNDTNDQTWAGFLGIYDQGKNNSIHDNYLFHNSVESESTMQSYAMGIKIYNTQGTGTTKVFNNHIYHTASHGIMVMGYFNSGDTLNIYNNIIDHPGQAGISVYKTRSYDGIGGKGYIHGNKVSYFNRLAGSPNAGAGNSSCGIHLNDGVQSGVESAKPFIKWFVYENTMQNGQAPYSPKDEDSGGLAIDFNANGVEAYRNLIYNNWGKGIYVWNADNAKIYSNIIYGNDCGIVISSQGSPETANNNQIYNNTLYKNYNGNYGPGLNTEIYFGRNNQGTIIKNNILSASPKGYAFTYASVNSSSCVSDYNIVYQDSSAGYPCEDDKYGKQTFASWKSTHSGWEVHSINQNPLFTSTVNYNFSLQSTSPAINKGTTVGLTVDYSGKSFSGVPDIGAMEYIVASSQTVAAKTATDVNSASASKMEFNLMQNYPNPFNPSTTIRYNIPESAMITLKVYDIQGREVATLVNEVQSEGAHSVSFNAANLSSGFYFYQLNSSTGIIQTKKMQLIK